MLGVHGRVAALLGLILCGGPVVHAQQETIVVSVQPGKAVAGEVFEQQPVVQLLDGSGQLKKVTQGHVQVYIDQSPSGFAEIFPPPNTNYHLTHTDFDPTTLGPNAAGPFPFIEGIAIMSGLRIDETGEGFVLRFESECCKVKSQPFAVALGHPFKVALTVQPGTANGGNEFRPQPTVSVQDKGGNVVTTQNSGTITIRISKNPVAGNLTGPAGGFTLTFNQGIAPFQSMSINTAGSPYALDFTTDLALAGGAVVESFPFAVGIGDPYELRFMVTPAGMAGGTAFVDQPKIEVLDKGGNRVVENSIDRVRVFIQNNPSGGTISPLENRLVQIVRGVATFHNLRIDKTGNDYKLRFYFVKNTRGTQIYRLTTLYVDSPNFNVVQGKPQRLVLSRAPANAWAGGSPIGVQPALDIQDLGGNVISTDSASTVAAHLTPSIGVSASIVVNTAAAPVTTVVQVISSKTAGEYGQGEVIEIVIEFTQDVTVAAGAAGFVPGITLNAAATSKAQCITIGVQARKQTFRYVVQAGENTAQLNYVSTTSLQSYGGTVLDGNGRPVLLALPAPAAAQSLGSQTAIQINTDVPAVTGITCTTPGSGRYGAGEILDILVTFSKPLTITGSPRLELVLDSAASTRYATYHSIAAGTNTVVFQYTVQTGDMAARLRHVTSNIDLNGGTVKRQATTPTMDASLALGTLSGSWLQDTVAIEVDTTAPKVDDVVGITVEKASGTYTIGEVFYIDIPFTDPVVVSGTPRLVLETNPSPSASDTPADYMGIGSGTKVLRFMYQVRLTDSTLDLDVFSNTALGLNGGSVKRYVSRGTAVTDADLSLLATRANSKSLNNNLVQKNQGDFVIDGSVASVSTIGIMTTQEACADCPGGTAGGSCASAASSGTKICTDKGDTLDIRVTFSAPVVVDTTGGTPSIELQTGDVNRDAAYIAGSGTNQLIFRYTVMLGDITCAPCEAVWPPTCSACATNPSPLDYVQQTSLTLYNRYELPNAEGYIRRLSGSPTSNTVNLVLPNPLINDIGQFMVETGYAGTKPISVTTTTPPGTYGVGHNIRIKITFNDEVVTPTARPKIFLNSNTNAKGDWAHTELNYVEFNYKVQNGDTSANLGFASDGLACTSRLVTSAAGSELMGGPIKNLAMRVDTILETPRVDCSLAGLTLQPSGIIIDTTAPKIVTVRSLNPTNPAHGGVYVVGDVITIIITFNLEVDVRELPETSPDKTPRLTLQTAGAPFETLFLVSKNRVARYVGYGPNGKTEAKFEYVVQPGDYSDELQYVDVSSLDLNFGQASIKRLTSAPDTDAVLTLPGPTSAAGKLAAAGQTIKISGDTDSFLPRVIDVASTKPAGVYGGGETIYINVTFSMEVVVNCYRDAANTCQRQPYLILELGEVDRRAMWDPDIATGECDTQRNTVAEPRKVICTGKGARILTFKYTAGKGDFTYDLDYVDRNSLQLGLGTILHASTTPSTVADLTLPYVGSAGSLGHNNAIQIDGLVPYVTSISTSATHNCGTWLAGVCTAGYKELSQTVDIAIVFSAPVSIIINTTHYGAVGTPAYADAFPYLKMFLGRQSSFHRPARYLAGDGTTELKFRYTVETGDATTDLDYVDSSAFTLQPFTYLRRQSANPVIDADVWLNPPGGNIFGNTQRVAEVGQVKYRDLLVDKRGKGYKMYFRTAAGGGLYTMASFDVIYSSEFEVMSLDRSRGDRFGSAVSVHKDTAVIGSMHNYQPVHEIQTVTTSGTSTDYVQEIQMIQLSAKHVNEVQVIESFASPGQTVGGYFTIHFGALGPTRALPFDIHPMSLRTYLGLDIPEMGRTTITRAKNTYCACHGAYVWTITFEELQGLIVPMTVTSSLTGGGATISPTAAQIVKSTQLGGTFQLSAGHDPVKVTTLPYDATPIQMFDGITNDLGIQVFNVDRGRKLHPTSTDTGPDKQGGYTWTVTFASSAQQNDVPQLIGSRRGLTGFSAGVRTWTTREGRAPLGGSFRLQFRADTFPGATTSDISFDASAAVVKSRLEALPSISRVSVTRSTPTADMGYTWSITFESVVKSTPYGAEVEQIEGTQRTDYIFGNLPALVSITNRRLNNVQPPACQSLDPRACPPSPGPIAQGHTDPTTPPVVVPPTVQQTPTVGVNETLFQAGETLVDITPNMPVYSSDSRGWKLNSAPSGVLNYSNAGKYILPSRFPNSGACSVSNGFNGGGAGFTTTAPHMAYICCGNYQGDRTTVAHSTDGSSSTNNLFSFSHKGPSGGTYWTQLQGTYGIINHASVPNTPQPCTWYSRFLPVGTHAVCCEGTWGTGVVLHPYVPEPEPFSPCEHQFHTSCTPRAESVTQHPYHLGLNGTSPLLLGSGAQVTVDSVISGSTSPFWEAQRRGDTGQNAGAAYVFVRNGEFWQEQQKLVGMDTDSQDRLGASASVFDEVAVVGAPGAEDYDVNQNQYIQPGTAKLRYFEGLYEQQAIKCTATAGYFRLFFRGLYSANINYDATSAQFEAAIEGMGNIHSVVVRSYTGALCRASSPPEALVTFIAPDGNFESLEAHVRLASTLTLQNGGASTPGTVDIVTVTDGEQRRISRGAACGAAYVFRRNSSTFEWTQEAKLLPETPSVAADFGYSVVTDSTKAIVGAPGEEENRGVLYVFKYDSATKRWWRAQRLSSSLYDSVSHEGPGNPAQSWTWPKGGRFGHSVAMSGDTIVSSAVGVDNSRGAVYVIKRTPNKDFQFFQRLHAPTLVAGDQFGYSVAISGNTVVVGATLHDAFGTDAGAVFTYKRKDSNAFFYLHQTLKASDAQRDDRFGLSVAISQNTIVASAHEDYVGELNPRAAVQSITTSAASTIGGYFRVGYKVYKEDNVWNFRQSRSLLHDITPDALKRCLELDLNTDEVLVSRTAADAQGGYRWLVTFVGAGTYTVVPTLEAESDEDHPLTGTGVDVIARTHVPAMKRLRSNAYIFTRDSADGNWTEQAALVPKSKQYSEYFGYAAALHEDTALLGCINRDTYVSEINAGAGYFFDLGFLNIGFSSPTYSVQEGGTLAVPVNRCNNGGTCHTGTTYSKLEEIINFDTGDVVSTDRTNQLKLTKLLNQGYGGLNQLVLSKDSGGVYYPEYDLWLDPQQVSTATERGQTYGSSEQRSVFVDTQYDYVGVSDHAPASGELTFLENVGQLTFNLFTTDDSLVEQPDEFASLRLSVPGVLPSYGGKMWATVTLQDDGDGMSTGPLRAYTSKLYVGDDGPPEQWPSKMASGSQYGFAVSVDAGRGFAIAGAPNKLSQIGGQLVRTGAAYVYAYAAGMWSQVAALQPESGPIEDSNFGVSVCIDGYLGNNVRAVVGAPGNASAFVFVRKIVNGAMTWAQEKIFTAPGITTVNDRFGHEEAVAIHGDYAVVGAPGYEAIFIYERNATAGAWMDAQMMRSSDYDYDRILNVDYLHRPKFGSSVDVNVRTISVGATRAEYGNRGVTNDGSGTLSVENYDTDGLDPNYMGRGKVYLFYTEPQAHIVTLRNDALSDDLKAGQWKVSMTTRGRTDTTTLLDYDASTTNVQSALESLSNVDKIRVTRTGNNKNGYTWSVTYLSENAVLPGLQVMWNGYGCPECAAFSSIFPQPELQMFPERIADVVPWREIWTVQAPDRNPDDLFGISVSLSNDQLVVGAPGSSVLTSTTWDFETGDLLGWRKTGTAFDFQPTYGDNSIARSVYDGMEETYDSLDSSGNRGRQNNGEWNRGVGLDFESYGIGQSARLEGRYYIGTFEKRPGKGHVDTMSNAIYNKAKFPGFHRASDYKDPSTLPPGSIQGDGPQGTLTSQPFTFNGTRIHFRVGGGCSIGGDYWNPLTEHIGGGVYVELLVDGLSVVKTTGRCSESMERKTWDVAEYYGRTGQIRIVDASSAKWGHINFDEVRFDWNVVPESTPNAGAAYAFRRRLANSHDSCSGDATYWPHAHLCEFEMQAKLQATDKRTGDRFGERVSVDDSTGLAVVGSKYQAALDHYKVQIPGRSGTGEGVVSASGAVYLFARTEAVRDGQRNLLAAPFWPSYEHARLQASDFNARDYFGASVALSEHMLFVGATGDDGKGLDGGAVYQHDVEFVRLKFRQRVFTVQENVVDRRVAIVVQRLYSDVTQPLLVTYSTSDMDAVGVDKQTFDACQLIPITERTSACGDYQLTTGELTIDAGLSAKPFFVPIMDNGCYEHKMEYFKVQLSVPGGNAILGERFEAVVRIDDDDELADPCT